jgi:glycosyltransferase involved in cell wall biosynthesis
MIADPQVSVVMPVYNAGKYLRLAIESILRQDLRELELIIVNDCSTDNSHAIISALRDDRIVYLRHDRNKGVVEAANYGLLQARAPYTAIMHADDMATPTRLRKQKEWLDERSGTAAVSSLIRFMDEAGNAGGTWADDQKTLQAAEIRHTMAWRNCIAHPTVMLRSDVYQEYRYHRNQQSQEDYDLWLRMLSAGLVIEKIPEPLLSYRVHPASITSTILRKANPFFKQFDCKKKFLQYQLQSGKWGAFESKVLGTLSYDGVMGVGKNIKGTLSK